MPRSNTQMVYKLQFALNKRGYRILCNRSQFYSDEQKRPVTIYKISQSVYDEVSGRNSHIELFSTASEIQEVLFLRNLWYLINGKEIPPLNDMKGADEFKRKWQEFLDKYESHFR